MAKLRLKVSVVAVLLVLSQAAVVHALCPGGERLADFAQRQIVLADDTLFFQTAELALDIDGSPSAYGVRDQGLEDICNGLGPLQPPECRGKIRGECYAACRTAFASWNGKVDDLGTVMCSIGLGGGGCSVPSVKLQGPPREAWFVSETSVRVAPPVGTPVTKWVQTQPAQLDTAVIPYFVIPGKFRKLPWDATPGDIGLVVDAQTQRQAAFVVGDTGGTLDEGSARLLAILAGVEQLPTKTKTSAFGEPVERLVGARSGDFRVAIFRHTAPLLPPEERQGLSVLDKPADTLVDWIKDTVGAKLAEIGGVERVIACTTP
jgi:hypothetical protein